ASRWQRHLRRAYRVGIGAGWQDGDAAPELLVALHARRSAPALAAFKAAHPGRPALLVLTGTDLYRDIHEDDRARASLALADAIVVLQPAGLDELDAPARAKARVIYQSAPAMRPRRGVPLDFLMLGHLRQEK